MPPQCWPLGESAARLLAGEAWEQAKGDVVTALQLTAQPDPYLAELGGRLDTAYRLPPQEDATKVSASRQIQSRDRMGASRWPRRG